MNEDIRGKIFNEFIKLTFECDLHHGEVANMIFTKEEVQRRGLVCVLCLPKQENGKLKDDVQTKSLKIMMLQIHQSCQTLHNDAVTSAFVDHHVMLIRGIAKNHFKEFEATLQASITNYFHKIRQLLNGKYFQQFYLSMSNIVALRNKYGILSDKRQLNKWNQRLMGFIFSFDRLVAEYQQYPNLPLEERLSGKNLIKYIRLEVGEIYKDFKEKAQSLKKNYQEEQILSLFNVAESSLKSFKFSSALLHSDLKITDPKSIIMPNLPDNQYTLLSLIEPPIGNKKRSIRLRMDGIKGWVAVGIAFKNQVEKYSYKFQQTNHGTVQISYDGYSWSNDSSVNEQYTSWYFNENDIITMTINPPTGELTFQRNEDTNTHVLKYTKEKNEKVYFCVSLNYSLDAVSILD